MAVTKSRAGRALALYFSVEELACNTLCFRTKAQIVHLHHCTVAVATRMLKSLCYQMNVLELVGA